MAGGVAANSLLRSELVSAGNKNGITITYPKFEYCTDNGAMIAMAGYHKLMTRGKECFAPLELNGVASLSMEYDI